MQRLLASCRMTRSQTSVVSFSARDPHEFPSRRVFRHHLQRWDFEGYGICVDRDWLQQRGARPVIYGDQQTWDRLDVRQQPFFQLATSRSGVAWTTEREWRHPGDVDLSELAPFQAKVFVPSAQAVETISLYSRWRVICLT